MDLLLDELISEEGCDDSNNTEHEDDARILLREVFLSFEELVHVRIGAARDKRVVNGCHLGEEPEQESVSISMGFNSEIAEGIKGK